MQRIDAVHIGVVSRDVISNILALHFPEGTIADLTWGKGAFWKDGLRERVVARLDLAPRYGADIRADSRHVPLRDQSVDVAIFDPPHRHAVGKTTKTKLGVDYDCLPRQTDITALVEDTLPELRRIARQGCIIKITDMVESGRFYPQHVHTIADAAAAWRLLPIDLAILYSGVIRPCRAERILHLRHSHSYFLIYKWRKP
jgi:hypothetical protein